MKLLFGKYAILVYAIGLSSSLFGQVCSLTISGHVADENTHESLNYCTVYIEELSRGVLTDSAGNFVLKEVCPGEYHIRISHISCEAEKFFIKLTKDTVLHIHLHHHVEFAKLSVVHGERAKHYSAPSTKVEKEEIAKNGDKSLAEAIENVNGVSVLKNGSGVSKPVIHGLYGNRISIVNNEINQGGQQWGNDHAPEIDPFVANNIEVIKGASAIEYSSTAMGGVVLINTKPIPNEPHLHGRINSIGQSNGRGFTINGQLEKTSKHFAWRTTATVKQHGDLKSPDYYLRNTGRKEMDFALQLEKQLKKWKSSFYYSLFSAELGILRGSHIGNITDLEEALTREEPFYTEEEFNSRIDAPKQKVSHHLTKLKLERKFSSKKRLDLTYAFQFNDRKEFDVRRSNTKDLPSLSLSKQSHFFKSLYTLQTANKKKVKLGLTMQQQLNTNRPETGILPLIPDYSKLETGAFVILSKKKKKWYYEAGLRYDLKLYDVAFISKSLPRAIERYSPSFHNVNALLGGSYMVNPNFKLNLSTGFVQRAPEVNELYSNGLHQGVSGIEQGDKALKSELSSKTLLTTDYKIKEHLYFQGVVYYQRINNYIYLQGQDSFQLTIRGAYPLFHYKQTNAVLKGADLALSYEWKEKLKIVGKYSMVEGSDVKANLPLINIPSSLFRFNVKYSFENKKSIQGAYIEAGLKHVLQQDDILEEQDFLAPPNAYTVIDLSGYLTWNFNKTRLRLGLAMENLLNENYRDYLNRQRYFSDDLGTNVKLRLGYDF